MPSEAELSAKIIAKAEEFPGIRAGIARLEDVLNGSSYRVTPDGEWTTSLSDDAAVTDWPPDDRSVLVLGLSHPEDDPRLDWWELGNTWGNKRLMQVSEVLKEWIRDVFDRHVQPLPYHVEKGGLFLKDAAVLAGLGIVGRNNLLLHPLWGPRIRLRSLLIEGDVAPTQAITGFSPCDTCDEFCQSACPAGAFPEGAYNRPRCLVQLNQDREKRIPAGQTGEDGTPNPVITFCRACELACPLGK
jgi:epoxyqueuosine reductase